MWWRGGFLTAQVTPHITATANTAAAAMGIEPDRYRSFWFAEKSVVQQHAIPDDAESGGDGREPAGYRSQNGNWGSHVQGDVNCAVGFVHFQHPTRCPARLWTRICRMVCCVSFVAE